MTNAIRNYEDARAQLGEMHTQQDLWYMFSQATRILRCQATRILRYYATPEHGWHRDLQSRFDLHPLVHRILQLGIRPANWQQLLLEWPHVSIDDDSQIAYTRNEADGHRDRQLRCSVGRYLARHWHHVPDHILRDWAGSYGGWQYAIWDTKELIIAGVELGPQSCMKSSYGSIPFRSSDNEALLAWFNSGMPAANPVHWDRHPYQVYDPALGWRMAVRFSPSRPDVVMGRCLINEDCKNFVRSYKRHDHDPNGYSHTDERLEAWLMQQGYTKASDWESQSVAVLKSERGEYWMPYIDGSVQNATLAYRDGRDVLVIDEGGEYDCSNTSGFTENAREAMGTCEDCDDAVYDEDNGGDGDHIYAGRYEDRLVCSCCADNYRHAYGADSRGRCMEYFVHEDYCIEVNGDYYDADTPPETIVHCADEEWRLREDCVECEDGEWRLREDCVECADEEWRPQDECIEHDGKWYPESNCVECADGETRPVDVCWMSAKGKYYSNDDTLIELPAGMYHPDELREMADNTI